MRMSETPPASCTAGLIGTTATTSTSRGFGATSNGAGVGSFTGAGGVGVGRNFTTSTGTFDFTSTVLVGEAYLPSKNPRPIAARETTATNRGGRFGSSATATAGAGAASTGSGGSSTYGATVCPAT